MDPGGTPFRKGGADRFGPHTHIPQLQAAQGTCLNIRDRMPDGRVTEYWELGRSQYSVSNRKKSVLGRNYCGLTGGLRRPTACLADECCDISTPTSV